MKIRLTINSPSVKVQATELIKNLPTDSSHEVLIRARKKSRSADQNALYWYFITIIAGERGETKDAMHYEYKKRFLVHIFERDDPEGYGTTIESVRTVYRAGMKNEALHLEALIISLTSTTKAGVKQFAEYLRDIEQDAVEKGIYIPRREDIYYEAMGITKC